jgi:hypothetical protein
MLALNLIERDTCCTCVPSHNLPRVRLDLEGWFLPYDILLALHITLA